MTEESEESPSNGPTRTKKKVKDELDYLSTQLTDRARFIAVGAIGGSWAILGGTLATSKTLFVLCIALGVGILILDFFQYLLPYRYFYGLRAQLLAANAEVVPHNDESWWFRGRFFLFHAKLIVTALAALAFMCAVGSELATKLAARPAPATTATPAPPAAPAGSPAK